MFPVVAAVIPCYRVSRQVLDVVAGIGSECSAIYVVDDCCPEKSGQLVKELCNDPRVRVIVHGVNGGVGAAVISGYRRALADGASVVVKLDGDGQMDAGQIGRLVAPILRGEADYTKGNRFYDLDGLMTMPAPRLIGNAGLSFLTKLSSGYWDIFDPTNGFTAIHAAVLRVLPLDKLEQRYFFESDMLFRLNTINAVVMDVPMPAHYANETSNLKVWAAVPEFLYKHGRNFLKRLFYNYFLRSFSLASVELVFGLLLLAFGLSFGGVRWIEQLHRGGAAANGVVMLAALPVILGMQMLLAFLGYDIANVPHRAVHKLLEAPDPVRDGTGQASGTATPC